MSARDDARADYATGGFTRQQIADKYEVSLGAVKKWMSGERGGDDKVTIRVDDACGTIAGWWRHRRSGTPACFDCLEANRAYAKAHKRTRRPVAGNGFDQWESAQRF